MTEAGRHPWYDANGRPIPPYVVGVAGGSASGKTSIAKEILRRLPNVPWVAIISQDAFYRPLTPEQTKQAFAQNFDFDHPSAIDQELLVQCIRDLKKSRAVQIPVYSFTQHQRTAESTYLYGHAVIVVEGIFVLQDAALRSLLDLKIFVQTDPDIMLARRIRRDILDRGRSVEGVLDQYLRFVKPSFDTFVSITAKYADIIVPGANNAVAIDVISQHIAKHLRRKTSQSALMVQPDPPEEAVMAHTTRHAQARLLLGTTAQGHEAHAVELEPFSDPPQHGGPGRPGAPPWLATVHEVMPLPSNVLVVPPTTQLNSMLTQLHDSQTQASEFAFACKRIGTMVVEAATALLPYRPRTVELPTGGTYTGVELDTAHMCAVSILRSGAVLEHALRRAFPALSLGSLLIQSLESNRHPLLYSVDLPSFIRRRDQARKTWVFLTDAQIGTGAAAVMAIRVLLDHGVPQHQIVLLALLASAKGGLWAVHHAFPHVRIVVAGVDPGLRRIVWRTSQLNPLPRSVMRPELLPEPRRSEQTAERAESDKGAGGPSSAAMRPSTSTSSSHLADEEILNAQAGGEEEDSDEEALSAHRRGRVVFAIIPGCGNMGDRFWGT